MTHAHLKRAHPKRKPQAASSESELSSIELAAGEQVCAPTGARQPIEER